PRIPLLAPSPVHAAWDAEKTLKANPGTITQCWIQPANLLDFSTSYFSVVVNTNFSPAVMQCKSGTPSHSRFIPALFASPVSSSSCDPMQGSIICPRELAAPVLPADRYGP